MVHSPRSTLIVLAALPLAGALNARRGHKDGALHGRAGHHGKDETSQ